MENNRTELISLWLTKEVAKEIKFAESNKTLQDEIIKRFVKSEVKWMEGEMKQIDEEAIKYKAKLITIKDTFAKVQDEYIDEIEQIYSNAEKTFKNLDNLQDDLSKKVEKAFNSIKTLSEKISYIHTNNLEKLLNLVDRYNSMSSKEKELVKLLLKED